jgi:ribosomal protein S18 acetylase RimI-like enzyme
MVMQSEIESVPHERFAKERPGDEIRSVRFSQSVWNIDWAEHFPLRLWGEGVSVEQTTIGRALPFVVANYERVFEEDPATSPFMQEVASPAKARYFEQMADCFEFRVGHATGGFMICTPVDWNTYYIRLTAILPEYRGMKFAQNFLPALFEILKVAGIDRVETDTSPSNLAVINILNKLQFNVTGTTLSERWGSLLKFTKFLNVQSEEVFLRQFCAGIKYQTRGGSNRSE